MTERMVLVVEYAPPQLAGYTVGSVPDVVIPKS